MSEEQKEHVIDVIIDVLLVVLLIVLLIVSNVTIYSVKNNLGIGKLKDM